MAASTGTDFVVAAMERALDGDTLSLALLYDPLYRPDDLALQRLEKRRPGGARTIRNIIDNPYAPHQNGAQNGGHPEPTERKYPAPFTVTQLCELPEPEEQFIAEPFVPANGNLLVAAYPKSCKTTFVVDLAISAASEQPFLGKYKIPKPRKVGVVLMEDRAHRIRRKMRRLCKGLGFDFELLEGMLYTWIRPPCFKLSDAAVMRQLRADVEEYGIELMIVDNWTYVSTGNSNDADEVTPQLMAFTEACGPTCTPCLVHHARKTLDNDEGNAQRLTDIIRNSSSFGGWYDAGYVLARKDERSPVKVRTEFRDMPAVDPFAFELEDEYPGTDDRMPGGWLRLTVSDKKPDALDRAVEARRLIPDIVAFIDANPGCSKNQLRKSVTGDNDLIELAFKLGETDGVLVYETPQKKGGSGKCWVKK